MNHVGDSIDRLVYFLAVVLSLLFMSMMLISSLNGNQYQTNKQKCDFKCRDAAMIPVYVDKRCFCIAK